MGACASACVKDHNGEAGSKQKASDNDDNNVLAMSDSVVSVDSPRHKGTPGKSPRAPSTAPTSNSQFADESALDAGGVVLDVMTPTDDATTSATPAKSKQPPLTVSVPAIVAKLEQQKGATGSPRPITLHTRNLSAAAPAVPLDSPVAHTPVSSRAAIGPPPVASQDSFAAPLAAATAEAAAAPAAASPMATTAVASPMPVPSPKPWQSPAAAALSPKSTKSPAPMTKSAAASPAAKPAAASPAPAKPAASPAAKAATPPASAEKPAAEAVAGGTGASPVQLTSSSSMGPRIRQPFAAAAPTANSLSRQRSAAQVAKEESAIAMRASSLASFLPAPAKPLNRTETFEAKLAAKKTAAKKKYKKTGSGKKLVK